MNAIFFVDRNIESLEEIVDEVPVGTIEIICINKGLKSLKGIERLLFVTTLYLYNNQITSLEDLVGSNVTGLNISGNPCYQQFQDEFEGSVQSVKEHFGLMDTPKDPGYD